MIIFLFFLSVVNGNVIGIDFGSELIKVSLIKPGKKLVIVENEESDRMTFNGFATNGKESLFGTKAKNALVKYPESSVRDLRQVLGKSFEDFSVSKVFNQSFSAVEVAQGLNGGVSYKILDKLLLAEEVAGLVLQNIGKFVEKFSGTYIKDCVIVVPSNYNALQKQSLLTAVKLSGLNLLSFIQENSASALYYSIDRIDDETDHLILVWNIGSYYTQISLLTIWGYKTNNKYLSHVNTLGHEYTEEFGGNTIDYELSQLLILDFFNKYQIDLKLYPKALAKVLREVNMGKKTLSANKKTEVFIENIVNGVDLKFEISRDMLNQIIDKYREKILVTGEKLCDRLNVDFSSIHEIELVGGITRIPKVQEIIEDRFMKKPSFHIHPFESMAHGAALLAAMQSASVSSTPFTLEDVSSCSISVHTTSEEILLFPKNFNLNSIKSLQIQIPDSKTLDLTETCHSTSLLYKYTFTDSGFLNLTFYLDSNGFVSLKSSTFQGKPINYSVSQTSTPRQLTEQEVEQIIKSSQKSKDSESENEYLANAKNDVETIMYFFKDKMQEETFVAVLTEEEKVMVNEFIQDLASWMETKDFEKVTENDIREKTMKLREPVVTMLEKENDFKVREKMINEGKVYLDKINTFMQMVNETATWIPREEVEEGWHVLRETEKWFEEKLQEQEKLKNWEKPAITSKECDSKFLFLRSQLDKFANYKPPGVDSNEKQG